ncbi:LOW QUALITY PROTEIN: uncharacterized protein [Argopecten irradians]|uniref:LOW QUALITY PROTEIN: uncharacterized protein n=1 Tax=Argopecten irradians TaxID=31199 RepID=UPI003714EB89
MPWVNELLCRIQYQDHTGVKRLLQSGTSPNRACVDNRAPLLVAIDNSDLDMVKLLIDHGADVNVTDSEGESALHYATQDTVEYEVMEVLLKAGADVNCLNMWSRTALHYVCYGGDLNKIELLVKIPQIRVDIHDEDGNTCLHALMTYEEGEFDDTEFWRRGFDLLIDAGVDINTANRTGKTALHMATEHKTSLPGAILSTLLDISKDLKPKLTDADGKTFLHLFIDGFSEDSVLCKLLNNEFKAFKDWSPTYIKDIINMEDRNGLTPFLIFLFSSSHVDVNILQRFVRAGADVKKTNSLGRTPLHRKMMAELSGNRHHVCKILLDGGANTNTQDYFGMTPLFWARTEKQVSIMCGAGADVSLKDKFGRNALMSVMLQGQLGAVELLIRKGCCVDSVDAYGSTALHYAVWMDDAKMLKTLLDVGGNPSIADSENRTPNELALMLQHTEISTTLDIYDMKTFDKDTKGKEVEIIYERVSNSSKAHWLGNNLTINHEDVVKSGKCSDLLEIHGYNGNELPQHLLNKPGSGKLYNHPETREVIDSVKRIVEQMSKRISQCDPRFKNSIIPMGSAREGTKTGYPDEFDFVCCLSEFLEYCNIRSDNGPKSEDFVALKLRDNSNLPSQMKVFFDKNGSLKSYDIRMELFKLIWDILKEKDMWQDANVLFEGDDMRNGYDHIPVLNFQIVWIGSVFKGLKISIDFVPAIRVDRTLIDIPTRDECTSTQVKNAVEAGFFMLLHPPDFMVPQTRDVFKVEDNVFSRRESIYDEELEVIMKNRLRVSCAPMEVSFLESLPLVVRESYVLAKIIKCECPKVKFNEEFFSELYERDPVEIRRHEDVHFTGGEYSAYAAIMAMCNETPGSDTESKMHLHSTENTKMEGETESLDYSKQSNISGEDVDSVGMGSYNVDISLDDIPSGDTEIAEESDQGYEANNDITSYMLKNVLFHLVGQHPELCANDFGRDLAGEERLNTTVDLTIKIFELLKSMSKTGELPVYFLPQQNIFKFAFEFRKPMDEEEMRRQINSDGNKRDVFLSLMLSILKAS